MPGAEPRVLLRTTCGARIGLGHYRRSLTLAEALAVRGAAVRMCVLGDERAAEVTRGATVPLELHPLDADPAATLQAAAAHHSELVIVDDYAVDDLALQRLRAAELAVGVLDDLADRALDVEAVLNGAPGAEALAYRAPLRLLGVGYALLRAELNGLPPRIAPEEVGRVLVILGGSDPRTLTEAAARAVLSSTTAAVDVVVGPLSVRPTLEDRRVRLHVAPPDLPLLMKTADLAVSAAGQTLYELCASGVPTIGIEVVANQRPQLDAFVRAGALVEGKADALAARIASLASDRALRQALGDRGQALVDGQGAARAAQKILELVKGRRSTHG